jgi:hypothetical protein
MGHPRHGYLSTMAERKRTIRPVEERRPVEADGVPDEEGISQADVADRVDQDPDEQLNRPEQDMPEEERRQF